MPKYEIQRVFVTGICFFIQNIKYKMYSQNDYYKYFF